MMMLKDTSSMRRWWNFHPPSNPYIHPYASDTWKMSSFRCHMHLKEGKSSMQWDGRVVLDTDDDDHRLGTLARTLLHPNESHMHDKSR